MKAADLLARYLDQRRLMADPPLYANSHREELLRAARPERPRAVQAAALEGPARTKEIEGLESGPLRSLAAACTACALSKGRRNVVFSGGNPKARVLVVGEAPGRDEDRAGEPFVGAAGRLLDLMLATAGLSRNDSSPDSSVYICNVIKCRPPGNRNPAREEINACAPFLKRQIELLAPKAIVALGVFAGRWLTGESAPLNQLRRKARDYNGIPVVATYHPAGILRNPYWRFPAWRDLQKLRQLIGK